MVKQIAGSKALLLGSGFGMLVLQENPSMGGMPRIEN